jgi:subtilisin family serine protease
MNWLKVARILFRINVLMAVLIVLILMAMSRLAHAKTLKVAVIDTGFDFQSTWQGIESTGLVRPKLCSNGHKDFTGTGLSDNQGHGTHVAGLIAKNNQNTDYCLIIIKYYDPRISFDANRGIANTAKAIEYAIFLNADVINYSSGGREPDELERSAIMKALKKGIHVIVAAGNEHEKLSNFKCNYFPACYDPRVESVGNNDSFGSPTSSSNYGSRVTTYRNGNDSLSLLPHNSYGKMTGTSMSAAIRTGEYINGLQYANKRRK